MPLGCDCYGGCWGHHSEGWPEVPYTAERAKFAVKELPYGSYVVIGTKINSDRYFGDPRPFYDHSEAVIRVEHERYARDLLAIEGAA